MGKAAGGMVTPMTPTARRAAYVVACAELVRRVVTDPAAVPPPAVFRDLRTSAARRAWLTAAGVDVPTTTNERTGPNHDRSVSGA